MVNLGRIWRNHQVTVFSGDFLLQVRTNCSYYLSGEGFIKRGIQGDVIVKSVGIANAFSLLPACRN